MKRVKYDFTDYERMLQAAVNTGCAQLIIAGRAHDEQKDPIYALTVTDYSIPDENKYHIVIAGLHVGGERAAMRAFYYAIRRFTSPAAARFRRHYSVTFMPSVNPYGCFRTDIDQQHTTPDGIDPYTGNSGNCFNYPALTLTEPEHNPELQAFLNVLDQQKPELLLDWHGANGRYDDDHMRESMGASLSNHLIMPWGTRLLAAMRKEITRGSSAVFDMEEYLERIPAPDDIKELAGPYFRPSWTHFYPDLYSYVKYHTMPIVLEIGQPETGWRALLGAMKFGLASPPEYLGAFPVDHIMVDFGSIVVHSGGRTPGERRASRCELQQMLTAFQTFYLNPCYLGQLGAVLAIGSRGLEQFIGQTPLKTIQNEPAANYPTEKKANTRLAQQFYDFPKRPQRWIPLAVNRNLDTPLQELGLPQNGLTLQLFIPIGHRQKITIKNALCNGQELKPDTTFGYSLAKGETGWYLFIHIPPEISRKQRYYCIQALYDMK